MATAAIAEQSQLALAEEPEQPGSALALEMTFKATILATPGAFDPILEKIKAEVRAQPSDVTTEKGRKAIASLNRKLASSKTFIDEQRKALVADRKAEVKAIDQEGSRIWDEFEALQKEVRKPLTEWEDTEKKRVEAHNTALNSLRELFRLTGVLPVADIEQRIADVEQLYARDWQEFAKSAEQAKASAAAILLPALEAARVAEAQAAELEKLRAEAAIREQKENEARIANEAVEREKIAARERELTLAREGEAARVREVQEREAAEARAEKAEADRLAAIEQARVDAIAAEEKARLAQEEAVAAERKRIEDAQRAEQEAAQARERDVEHRASINRQVRDALVEHVGLKPNWAEMFVRAVAKGLIPNVKINY